MSIKQWKSRDGDVWRWCDIIRQDEKRGYKWCTADGTKGYTRREKKWSNKVLKVYIGKNRVESGISILTYNEGNGIPRSAGRDARWTKRS